MTSHKPVNERLNHMVISAIADEIKDHFCGSFSDERAIRATEAHILSKQIWARISKIIAESFYEIPEAH